jgi:hypothetical protein
MWHLINSVWGWLTIGGIGLIALGAVAYFLPPFRKLCIEIGILLISVMGIYAKGVRDAEKRDRAKRDAAVEKNKKEFDRIDNRPDDPGTVDKRLRDGNF